MLERGVFNWEKELVTLEPFESFCHVSLVVLRTDSRIPQWSAELWKLKLQILDDGTQTRISGAEKNNTLNI